MIWNRRDVRIEPEDMFVALEETCSHLFWCTNYGYFGFIALAEENMAARISSSDPANSMPIEGLEDLVSFMLDLFLVLTVCTEARWPYLKS